MNYIRLITLLSLSAVSYADEADLKHQFVCIGNYKNVLVYVDQFTPENSWSINIPKGSREIQQISPEVLLVSHGTGAAEYRLSDGKKLDWEVTGYKGIQSARRLTNGNTLLLSSSGSVITLDRDGKELSKVQIKYKKLDLRLLRVAKNNNWIIGAKKPRAILEVNPEGEIIKQIKIPGKGYTVKELPNGNYLSSTGDECKVIEVKADGTTVRFVGGKQEHPELNLDFNSGWQHLENQNIIMTNWLGHNKHDTGPHLLEFNKENELVWKWGDHEAAKQVTNLLVLK